MFFFHFKDFKRHCAALLIRELLNSWFRFFDVTNMLIDYNFSLQGRIPHFLRSVNPTKTGETDYAQHMSTYWHPNLFDLPPWYQLPIISFFGSSLCQMYRCGNTGCGVFKRGYKVRKEIIEF